jgi:AbiV family abortive infection protein
MSDTRKYRNNLEFVETGLRACWRNANDLAAASKNLIDEGLHAPGLSLAVLALEEVGKLCAIDGLLFVRSDDHKAHTFGKSQRDHNIKLAALTLLPFLIGNFSRFDPRRENKEVYAKTMAISLHQLKSDENLVLQSIKAESIAALDKWKQKGFYVAVDPNAFVTPREAIDSKIAEAVRHFTWRAISTLDFVFKDGNLERYINQARLVRSNLSECDHQAFEEVGQQLVDIFFGSEEISDNEQMAIN